ncbi:MAG TPA: cellulose binding domain-containing protein [Actinocrinis sp.]|nr:cellulose binding domain-containing protein [Actinocrinis sp.]
MLAVSLPVQAATTLVVNANQPFRPVTHVATGSLYGLASGTVPADSLVEPLHPNTFVQMPAGGHQQPTGDILKVAPEAEKAGAKLVDRLSDYYAGWPYQFSWSSWPGAVSSQIQQVKAAGVTDLASWELWNEPDNTWLSANGTFESFWTKTYQQVRSLDATTPIQGPSFSDNISDMQNFLQNAVATKTVPDIIAWHELSSSSKIAGDVATVTNLEKSLGITPRPIAIEEYAAPSQVGVPGALVGYIAQFERLGVDNAELAFWNQSGALGDLLTGQGGSPNGAYWLYDWYAAMSGNMVSVVSPGSGLDGAAAVTSAQNQVSAVFGGGSGSTAVTVNGLSSLSGFSGSSQVTVTLQDTPSPGRTVAVSAPTTISQSTYTVTNGSITVPISSMNSAYGYHLTVTPVSSSGNTVTVTNPGSQTGTVGTAISGVQLHATDSASGQTLTYSATGLPTGLSINSSGLISGTPTASGSFNVAVTAKDSTGAAGSASFTWTISGGSTGGGGTCQVSYVKNEWTGGFTANVTVTNSGTAAINGWTLAFSFPGDQKVTNAWNATVSQSGAAVTATNVSYNAAIAPGGNAQFGFQGTWAGNDTSPTHFTVNGTACS